MNVISIAEGTIHSVNLADKTVRVKHRDVNGSVSTNLPLLRPKPQPEEGDAALVLYLSNGAAFGVCVGVPYQKEDEKSADVIDIAILPDGAAIQYNTATKTLILTATHVTVNGQEVGS